MTRVPLLLLAIPDASSTLQYISIRLQTDVRDRISFRSGLVYIVHVGKERREEEEEETTFKAVQKLSFMQITANLWHYGKSF